MCARVDFARRRRAIFFSMFVSVGRVSTRRLIRVEGGSRPALRLLGFFERDTFAGVAHALALVGLGWTERADLGSGFADALLVGALDQNFGLRRRFDRHAF